MQGLPRLREASPAIRLGLTGMVLTLAIGYAASLAHMVEHHAKKDERAGLSMDDLTGAYHGVDQPALLKASMEGAHGDEFLEDAAEKQVLLAWLNGGRLSEGYDSLEAGDSAPAEILARNCLNCHARNATEGEGIGETMPLEYWDDVERVAFGKQLDPVPVEILTVSTHTHALTLPLVALAACGLFLLTRFGRGLRHGVFALAGASVFLDVAGWWLARESAAAVWLIILAGAGLAIAVCLALAGTLLDLWLPNKNGRTP